MSAGQLATLAKLAAGQLEEGALTSTDAEAAAAGVGADGAGATPEELSMVDFRQGARPPVANPDLATKYSAGVLAQHSMRRWPGTAAPRHLPATRLHTGPVPTRPTLRWSCLRA